ncbi:MAG: YihY/virulence factor BrkB family protein [Gemmatimonadaceae bacterium]|nr:YihY/virulence factor BrkB family protein [Gemmatimonadaceae bacterium]
MIIKGFRVGPLLETTGREILNDNVLGLAAGVISIGAVLALWSGSAVFGSVMSTLNSAYNVTETRPWWTRFLIQLASVFGLGLLTGVASVVMLAGPELARGIGARAGLDHYFVLAWTILQYPLAIGMIVLAFFLVYRYLPNIKQHRGQILVGAAAGTVLWLLVTLLFRLYVTDFAAYNKTYGTIGGVIVLLTWMYLSMIVLLAGGELNSELHKGTGAMEPRRGAVYDGRVVTSANPARSSMDIPISPATSPTQLASIVPTSTAPSSPRPAPER